MFAHSRAMRASDGVVWEAPLQYLPLSTGANSAELRAALTRMGFTFARASAATVQTSPSTIVTTGIGVDDPRVGDAGYGRGLLLEETRTNLITQSRAINTHTDGGANVDVTVGQVGPDGGTAADRVINDGTGGQVGFYTQHAGLTGSLAASCWVKPVLGAKWEVLLQDAGFRGLGESAPSSAEWKRAAAMWTTAGSPTYFVANDGRGLSGLGIAAGARDATFDLLQLENAPYPSEPIITTGSAATRLAETLAFSTATANTILAGGSFGLELEFIPKFNCNAVSNQVSGFHMLWAFTGAGTDSYGYINNTRALANTDGLAGGSLASFSAGDRVRAWIESGPLASGRITQVKMSVNGAAPYSLGTNAAGRAAISVGTNNGILGNAGGAFIFSSWAQHARAYAPGRRPAWAA